MVPPPFFCFFYIGVFAVAGIPFLESLLLFDLKAILFAFLYVLTQGEEEERKGEGGGERAYPVTSNGGETTFIFIFPSSL